VGVVALAPVEAHRDDLAGFGIVTKADRSGMRMNSYFTTGSTISSGSGTTARSASMSVR
jgi:hypothetical protein